MKLVWTTDWPEREGLYRVRVRCSGRRWIALAKVGDGIWRLLHRPDWKGLPVGVSHEYAEEVRSPAELRTEALRLDEGEVLYVSRLEMKDLCSEFVGLRDTPPSPPFTVSRLAGRAVKLWGE